MTRVGVLIELLAIIAMIIGAPIPVAGMVALIAATPTTAVAIFRTWKTDKTVNGVIELVFYFFTWIALPCLLARYATDGVGENLFRFTIAARIFAAVCIWRLSSPWKQSLGGER
jgi:hypothetical protein